MEKLHMNEIRGNPVPLTSEGKHTGHSQRVAVIAEHGEKVPAYRRQSWIPETGRLFAFAGGNWDGFCHPHPPRTTNGAR